MDELMCSQCNKHVGWMIYCGPHGSVYCDDCKEDDDRREAEREPIEPHGQGSESFGGDDYGFG